MQPAQFKSLDLRLPSLAPSAKLYVAFSGGLDSTVLLHHLAALQAPGLHALHVDHGLQSQSMEWARHCEEFCSRLGVPYTRLSVKIATCDPAGPEAAARTARYTALRGVMDEGDCLATAHHRDDQAETLLLRLLRGSGVQGLAAMQALAEFAPGVLWRPLLDVPRLDLRVHAEAHGLEFIDDPHNRDPRYARSWLRAEILPRLTERFPEAPAALVRAASLAAEAAQLLDELASMDTGRAAVGEALSVPLLLQLTPPRRHNLLRFWLRSQGFAPPSAAHLARIAVEVLLAPESAMPCFTWTGCELRRYRDALHAMRPLPSPPADDAVFEWHAGERLRLPPGCGELCAESAPLRALTIRFARAGDRFRPAAAAHRRTLKNLFQENGIPPWGRARLPLIELDGELAVVAGVGGSDHWREFLAQTRWQLRWIHELRGLTSPIAI